MRRLVTMTCLLILALVSTTIAGEVVKVGVCLSLSGDLRESGRKALAGIRLRLDDYNEREAVGRPKLELVIYDDKGKPDLAGEGVRELAREGVAAIVGPLSTNIMLGMRDAATELGMVVVSPSVTSPRIGKNRDWTCRVLFDDEFQGIALARFLAQRQKMANAAAILNSRFAYAASVFKAFKIEYEKLGGKVVAEEYYDWTPAEGKDYDFSTIMEKVARANPDIVLLPDYSTEVAAIIRSSTKMRLGLRFCGGDTWQHEVVMLASGNDLENAFFISGINFDSNSPEMEQYIQLFDNSNDPDAQMTSVLGYDALSLLIEAMKNGYDSKTIRETLYSIKDFKLATGTITVDPERGSEKTAYIQRINMQRGNFQSRIIDEIVP